MPNIIIINRKWEESFDIPRWKAGPEYDAQDFQESFCKKFETEYLAGDKLKLSRLDKGGENFFLIKIYIDLKRLPVKNRTRFYTDFIQFFKKRVIQDDPILFLIHGPEGFKAKIPELCMTPSWYELFEGGGEPIYFGQGGILLDSEYHIDVLEEKSKCEPFSLKPARLSYIWNYYYNRTRQKLFHLRERVLFSQIPGYPEQELMLSKGMALNLLENLRVPVEDPICKAEVPANCDFSHGNDLQEVRTAAISQSLVQGLSEYVRTSREFYPELNEALEQMVSHLSQ